MRLRHHLCTLLILTIYGVTTAVAQPSAPRQVPRAVDPYQACLNRANTNSDFSDCGGTELRRQEARLAATWRAVLATFEPDSGNPELPEEIKKHQAAILAEQRAWLRFKTLSCMHWTEAMGREGVVLHFPSCRAAVIADRVTYLRETFLDRP
ncbi:MAG: DUF1311 domain-containing protein [Gemmatimonadota bacterium]|nr:DUF1311 domain-containing protein [Gemmatimonadota bacterium]MDQ8177617.1 DUF1311 domain-containing protein [Gemmatimonadota bacterium]